MRQWQIKNPVIFNYSIKFKDVKNNGASSTNNDSYQVPRLPPMIGVGKRFNKRYHIKASTLVPFDPNKPLHFGNFGWTAEIHIDPNSSQAELTVSKIKEGVK